MKSIWNSETESWNNTPDKIRRGISRDTSQADVDSEMELLK